MEFDWNNPPFELDSSLTQREIEESFEDPFALRVLPDSPRFSVQARCFYLGMSAGGGGGFSACIAPTESRFGCFIRGRSSRKSGSSISGRWIRLCRNEEEAEVC